MNVGLPGSGIGGMFYLISALSMPVVAVWRWLRSKPVAWRVVVVQAVIALGIVGGLVIAASALGVLVRETPLMTWAARSVADARRLPTFFRVASLGMALGTLASLVAAVWVAAFVVHGRAAFRRPVRRTVAAEVSPLPIARVSSHR